jgi:hypothetical protein
MARYDRMGLIWMLKGERVVARAATGARLSGADVLSEGVINSSVACVCKGLDRSV